MWLKGRTRIVATLCEQQVLKAEIVLGNLADRIGRRWAERRVLVDGEIVGQDQTVLVRRPDHQHSARQPDLRHGVQDIQLNADVVLQCEPGVSSRKDWAGLGRQMKNEIWPDLLKYVPDDLALRQLRRIQRHAFLEMRHVTVRPVHRPGDLPVGVAQEKIRKVTSDEARDASDESPHSSSPRRRNARLLPRQAGLEFSAVYSKAGVRAKEDTRSDAATERLTTGVVQHALLRRVRRKIAPPASASPKLERRWKRLDTHSSP